MSNQLVTITHPKVGSAQVPAKAVPGWERNGWRPEKPKAARKPAAKRKPVEPDAAPAPDPAPES